jgi:hypothetical protein
VIFGRWNRHVEPPLEDGIDSASKKTADVGALSGTGKRTEPIDCREILAPAVKIEDLLISGPGRLLFDGLGPSDLEGKQKPPRRHRSANEPWEKLAVALRLRLRVDSQNAHPGSAVPKS